MKYLLSAIVLATAVVGGATLASADGMNPKTMSCKDFSAMDSAGMMKAVDAMHMASPDSAMAMDKMATETAVKGTMTACDGHPDMMAMDAMMSAKH